MSNFASWYRSLSVEHQDKIDDLRRELKEILPGFHSLSLPQAGEGYRVLKAHFVDKEKNIKIDYNFTELSTGEKVLIILYALLYGARDQGYSLFLDEPENFLALAEIQPWLMNLSDFSGQEISQAVLISHHPEVIDYLGLDYGIQFGREANGPVRVKKIESHTDSDLKLSQKIERGWD